MNPAAVSPLPASDPRRVYGRRWPGPVLRVASARECRVAGAQIDRGHRSGQPASLVGRERLDRVGARILRYSTIKFVDARHPVLFIQLKKVVAFGGLRPRPLVGRQPPWLGATTVRYRARSMCVRTPPASAVQQSRHWHLPPTGRNPISAASVAGSSRIDQAETGVCVGCVGLGRHRATYRMLRRDCLASFVTRASIPAVRNRRSCWCQGAGDSLLHRDNSSGPVDVGDRPPVGILVSNPSLTR